MVSTEIPLISIGIVGRPVGFEGDIYLFLNDGIELSKPSHFFLEIEGLVVPFRQVKFKRQDDEIRIRLNDFDTKEKVAQLKSKQVFVESKFVTLFEEEESELVGFELRSESSKVGVIREVEDHGLNSLLKVEVDGDKVIYIPFHHDLVVAIDELNKVVQLKIADGLLDL